MKTKPLNRVQMTKLSTPSVATLLVPPVSGGQLLAQCLRYRLYPYLRASKRTYIIYKQSSGVCASLLLLLEYVTFWLN